MNGGGGGTADGERLHELVAELYPICRSITGRGVRETLSLLSQRIPIEIHEVRSGTPVLDWTVPKEWNISDAYIANGRGERVVDFADSNLHVVNYSVPVRTRLTLDALRPRLHTLPEQPDRIPYRTTYYREDWGFCLSQRSLDALREGEYEVCIESTLEPGSLTYGECVLQGERPEEVLLSSHVCHPSLANDNLSGVAVATFLAAELQAKPRRYTYRFVFVPGTIGAITWLARNGDAVARVRHGLVLTCLGDPGPPSYKRSRRGRELIDRAVEHVLRRPPAEHRLLDYVPWGYDERQYCSPGFDLPVGCLMRTPHGQFPEYHSSGDDLGFVRPEALAGSLEICRRVVGVLETDRVYVGTSQKGEPHFARHGLDTDLEAHERPQDFRHAVLWVLNLADGRHSLLDVAERADLEFELVEEAASALVRRGLLSEATGGKAAPTDTG